MGLLLISDNFSPGSSFRLAGLFPFPGVEKYEMTGPARGHRVKRKPSLPLSQTSALQRECLHLGLPHPT